ncbi:MAG: hypothetical protein EA391_09175 [Balneolaceae bacterium]|nr:MAG: hypothetical protein EA391_09175 [Balneolaceae bacterium]
MLFLIKWYYITRKIKMIEWFSNSFNFTVMETNISKKLVQASPLVALTSFLPHFLRSRSSSSTRLSTSAVKLGSGLPVPDPYVLRSHRARLCRLEAEIRT